MGDISPPSKTAPGGAFEQLFLKKRVRREKRIVIVTPRRALVLNLKREGRAKIFFSPTRRENKVGG